MNKLVPLLAFSVLLLAFQGINQEAYAVSTFVNDQASCENAPVLGVFNSGTCTLSGIHTIPINDNWFFLINSQVTGTVDVFGGASFRAPSSNSGVINLIGSTFSQGDMQIVSTTDYTNECVGIINLISGTGQFTGFLRIDGIGGIIPIVNNFGTINGINSDEINSNGAIGIVANPNIPILNNHGTINAPVILSGGIFNDNLPNQCGAIGGKIIPIDATSLILAGAQSTSWMIPVVLSAIGIGIFVVGRKNNNS